MMDDDGDDEILGVGSNQHDEERKEDDDGDDHGDYDDFGDGIRGGKQLLLCW